MIRRPPRSTLDRSSAASDVYKRQITHPMIHTSASPTPSPLRVCTVHGQMTHLPTAKTSTSCPSTFRNHMTHLPTTKALHIPIRTHIFLVSTTSNPLTLIIPLTLVITIIPSHIHISTNLTTSSKITHTSCIHLSFIISKTTVKIFQKLHHYFIGVSFQCVPIRFILCLLYTSDAADER